MARRPAREVLPGWCASRGDRSSPGRSPPVATCPTSSSTTCASAPSDAATRPRLRRRRRASTRRSSPARSRHSRRCSASCTTPWSPRPGFANGRRHPGFTRRRCSPPGELVALQRDAAERARTRVAGRLEARRARVVRCLAMSTTSYLVRHAKAGSRERWTAPDRDRPLTDAGRAPGSRPGALCSRPGTPLSCRARTVRCVETVAPLAEALGLRVEEEDRLAEGADPGWALDLLASTRRVGAVHPR